MAFATTNIDDIFILLVLFSQVRTEVIRKEGRAVREKVMRKKLYIVIGQYFGFSMIVFLSIVGSLSSFFIPVSWIGLLGFVPIYMGVKGLLSLRSYKSNEVIDNVTGSLFKVASITLAKVLEKNCYIIVPIVLIGLGMFILFRSDTIGLFS